MAYKRKTFRMPNAIEVEEYHSGRYGAPGQTRQKRKKPTPEQMAKKNQRHKKDICRRRIRNNFKVNDYYTTLTYAKEARPPDMEAAKKDFNDFIGRVRRAYRKLGHELKWIRNIEVGSRGAWHVHLILNRIPETDIILQEAWTHGGIHSQLMYAKDEFRDLAAYMTKSSITDERIRESSYSTSRNLPIPEPEVDVLPGKTWRKKPHVPKGWYLDQESYWEGINPVTGYPGRRYTLLRLPEDEKKTAGSGTYHRRC